MKVAAPPSTLEIGDGCVDGILLQAMKYRLKLQSSC